VSVAHELMRSEDLRDDRFMLIGYADTKPFTANDTPAGRALNRRVEIVIRQEELNQQRTELDMLLKQESQALDIMSIERDDP
jgi:chemotaxis protein MotB